MADDIGQDIIETPTILGPTGRRARGLSKSSDFTTRGDMEKFVENVVNAIVMPKVMEIVEHYMRQIPELNARMIGDAFAANGLEFKPPMPAEQMPDQPSTPS